MERDGARPEAGENESHLPCSSWDQKLHLLKRSFTVWGRQEDSKKSQCGHCR